MNDINKLITETMTQNGFISKQIDGSTYAVKLLPAVHAYAVAENLIQFLAPVIGCIYDGSEDEFGDQDMGTSIGLLVSKQIKELNMAGLSKILLQNVTKDGAAFNVETDLLGAKGLVVLAELTELALKENVFDFLSVWLGKKGLSIPSLDELRQMQGQTSEKSND